LVPKWEEALPGAVEGGGPPHLDAFWAHVGDGAHPAEAIADRACQLPRNAKVRYLELAPAVEEQVAGFDVSMDDAQVLMEVQESRQDLQRGKSGHLIKTS
jgi:hypothetical protein